MSSDDFKTAYFRVADMFPLLVKNSEIITYSKNIFITTLVLGKINNLENVKIANIGGGVGILSPYLSILGASVDLYDDFQDEMIVGYENILESVHKKTSVHIFKTDILKLTKFNTKYDAILFNDVIEHMHHSPRKLIKLLYASLKDNGILVISNPNSNSIAKRVRFLFGIGSWSRFDDWYCKDVFRGHVREQNHKDMIRIANDLQLAKSQYRIYPRNDMFITIKNKFIRLIVFPLELISKIFPNLACELYLVIKRAR